LLIEVPAWTKNVPELKKFFKNARKDMEKGNTFNAPVGQLVQLADIIEIAK
jgi:hypothetical protein